MANVRLVTFDSEVVTPQDDSILYQSATVDGVYHNIKFTISDPTTINVTRSFAIMGGRFIEIEDQNFNVALAGGSSNLVGQIYLKIDLSNADNPLDMIVETKNSERELTPMTKDVDLNVTNGIYMMRLCLFGVNSSTIYNLDDEQSTDIPVICNLLPLSNDFTNANIAPIESRESTRAYASGAYLIYNKQLYKTTTSIAIGGILKEGTNIQKTTLATLLATKVDKVSGKGLSTNDFTNALKTKLEGVETGATKILADTDKGIQITNYKIRNEFKKLSAPNLDNIKYNFQGYVINAKGTSIPVASQTGNGFLVVLASNDTQYYMQFFSPYNTNQLFYRKFKDGAWSNWSTGIELYNTAITWEHGTSYDNKTTYLRKNGGKVQINNENFYDLTNSQLLSYNGDGRNWVKVMSDTIYQPTVLTPTIEWLSQNGSESSVKQIQLRNTGQGTNTKGIGFCTPSSVIGELITKEGDRNFAYIKNETYENPNLKWTVQNSQGTTKDVILRRMGSTNNFEVGFAVGSQGSASYYQLISKDGNKLWADASDIASLQSTIASLNSKITALQGQLTTLTTKTNNINSGYFRQFPDTEQTLPASSAIKNLGNFTLTKGKWLVELNASFSGTTAGYRQIAISGTSSSSQLDRNTRCRVSADANQEVNANFTAILNVTDNSKTYYINAAQSSTATNCICKYGINAIKLND